MACKFKSVLTVYALVIFKFSFVFIAKKIKWLFRNLPVTVKLACYWKGGGVIAAV
jgi:hypothetical protein